MTREPEAGKSYFITIIWLVLFFYDVFAGLHGVFVYILPALFVITGLLGYFNRSLRPEHPIVLIAWVAILGWLIFVASGLLVEVLAPFMPQSSLFIYKPYLSWLGLASILVITVLFSIFGYAVFASRALYINLFAALVAGSLNLLLYGFGQTIFLAEAGLLVVLLCLATATIHFLAKRP